MSCARSLVAFLCSYCAHSFAMCAIRSLDKRRECPASLRRRHLTVSCRPSMPAVVVTSSLVMSSLHEMPNVKRRHFRWNTSSFCLMFLTYPSMFHKHISLLV
ncbi:hypothetical protein NP493_77g05083 [Ridgeia piscesae]|uniref:Secreted protein n=1 Tax=Ridgeia piscesae TaxID=27915 RepID=A0AAD9P9D8_RIDPI|nr:hypothetical protein NP493_77g05083 [Ridgeia piscesae]